MAKSIETQKINPMEELRKLSIADLNKALIEAKADLDKSIKMLKANELPASHVIKSNRQKIARIHTVMTEKSSQEEEK